MGVWDAHMLRYTGMCGQSGLGFCKKSLNVGPISHEKILCYEPDFPYVSQIWKIWWFFDKITRNGYLLSEKYQDMVPSPYAKLLVYMGMGLELPGCTHYIAIPVKHQSLQILPFHDVYMSKKPHQQAFKTVPVTTVAHFNPQTT